MIFFSLFKNPYVLSNLMAPKPGRLSSPFRFLACFQRCHSCLVWATAQDQLCPCPSRDLSWTSAEGPVGPRKPGFVCGIWKIWSDVSEICWRDHPNLEKQDYSWIFCFSPVDSSVCCQNEEPSTQAQLWSTSQSVQTSLSLGLLDATSELLPLTDGAVPLRAACKRSDLGRWMAGDRALFVPSLNREFPHLSCQARRPCCRKVRSCSPSDFPTVESSCVVAVP